MEENCLAEEAYRLRRESRDFSLETRRLLRFTTSIENVGDADFRPFIPKSSWEWHACHMHYHSMEVSGWASKANQSIKNQMQENSFKWIALWVFYAWPIYQKVNLPILVSVLMCMLGLLLGIWQMSADLLEISLSLITTTLFLQSRQPKVL